MIARVWRGATMREDADVYAAYIDSTGLSTARDLPGNQGAWLLRHDKGDRTEFMTVILWDSLDAIRAFAGDEVEAARFFPEDDRFLVERQPGVEHFDVAVQ
ncbi:MAG: hypothetical protein QOE36_505 [Gaiellaceae bacterium]|jgi:heme-degrading monooxygenase HmoA|nr:hypothetical protein [Gaiellaceae bacterium]